MSRGWVMGGGKGGRAQFCAHIPLSRFILLAPIAAVHFGQLATTAGAPRGPGSWTPAPHTAVCLPQVGRWKNARACTRALPLCYASPLSALPAHALGNRPASPAWSGCAAGAPALKGEGMRRQAAAATGTHLQACVRACVHRCCLHRTKASRSAQNSQACARGTHKRTAGVREDSEGKVDLESLRSALLDDADQVHALKSHCWHVHVEIYQGPGF